MCICGTFQPSPGTLWASVPGETERMAPLCASCGQQILALTTELPTERLALHTVINQDRLTEPSNAAVLNVKAALLAQFNWRDDPNYRQWLAQPPRQFVYRATQSQFDALVESIPAERRILIADYVNLETDASGKLVPPIVMLWILPVSRAGTPPALASLLPFE